jgi:hypothetical protein
VSRLSRDRDLDLSVYEFNQLLALGFGVLALLVCICVVAISRSLPLATKLLGSLFALSITFAANHWAVYAVGLFVVATLVTELQFLEKIAAIIWNRKEYWRHLEKASKAAIEEKRTAEILEDLGPSTGSDLKPRLPREEASRARDFAVEAQPGFSRLVDLSRKFEAEVVHALKTGKAPFPVTSVETQMSVSLKVGERVIDAIAINDKFHFMIEIRYQSAGKRLFVAAMQAMALSQYYREYLAERQVQAYVAPLLIIPSGPGAPTGQLMGTLVLQFDSLTQQFVGNDEFNDLLKKLLAI